MNVNLTRDLEHAASEMIQGNCRARVDGTPRPLVTSFIVTRSAERDRPCQELSGRKCGFKSCKAGVGEGP